MTDAPKIIEVPGIPGKLREQTLDEFVAILAPDHLARKQLAELRSLALDGMKSTQELLKALEKIRELEEQVGPLKPTLEKSLQNPVAGAVSAGENIPVPAAAAQPEVPLAFPKVKCPHCEMRVSTMKGAWASHMRAKHNLTDVPIPAA